MTRDRLAVPLAAAVVLLVGLLSGTAAAADHGPTVNATTTTTDGNLTIEVTGDGVTEIDVTDVPDSWSVVERRDDFGTYVDQLDGEDRIVWLWSSVVYPTPCVTFSTPANATANLTVVPYRGTTRGEAIIVSGSDRSQALTVPGQSAPATDLDGDGKFEDVTGDGRGTLFDALALYNDIS